MKAIILKDFGGVENLELTEKQIPAPGANEVLIKLSAISINPVDVKTRSGKGIAGLIKDQLPVILGWDISGTITEIGAGVSRLKPAMKYLLCWLFRAWAIPMPNMW